MKERHNMLNNQEMMSREVVKYDDVNDSMDLEDLETEFQKTLDEEFSSLELLEEEKEKIGNPDALGDIMLAEIWNQFANQIGLDITNETLNQKYEREHAGETYEDVGKKVMQDPRYKEKTKEMKEKQKAGELQDEYTGNKIGKNEKGNVDHVVSRKEIYENDRRRQAGIETEDLANKDENLKSTNESLNKSKGAKSVKVYRETREQREKDLIEQNKRANKKIDESNMSDLEKKKAKEKNNKRLKDKLAANDEMMKKCDEEARNAINRDIAIGVAKETVKKAGKDALKQVAITSLFALLKEVMNGFVRYLKGASKSFKNFMDEMKQAIKAFFNKIGGILKNGINSMVGTIVTEIFGPIVSVFKKATSFIKQGISLIKEVIGYLTSDENKNKPFSVKVAQVGKIIIAAALSGVAILLGEVLEEALLAVPGFALPIPGLGTLANIIGLFLASLVAGVAGAVGMNLIDKFMAKRLQNEAEKAIINKQNDILIAQEKVKIVNEALLKRDKETAYNNIKNRHHEAAEVMKSAYTNIMEDFVTNLSDVEHDTYIDSDDIQDFSQIDKLGNELDDMLLNTEQR